MLRKVLKFVVYVFGASLIVAFTLGFFVLDDSPLVEEGGPPTPDDVVEARAFVQGVRSAVQPEASIPAIFVSNEEQLNSVIKLGARFIPGFRGRLIVTDIEVKGVASIPVPYIQKWVNLRASAPEFEGTFGLSGVQIGTISVPPGLALGLGRYAANFVIGDNSGDTILSAATSMRIEKSEVLFNLAMDDIGSNGLMRGVFGTLRGSEMPRFEGINQYYLDIRNAMESGELPAEGTYLPYLIYTLKAALEGSTSEGIENAYTSAILALTLVCGASDFTLIVGGMIGNEFARSGNWTTDCSNLTLNGRVDSRRHFTTAAALQAVSNRGVAVSIGEFKELYDTVKSGGFDFTDLAANNSGVRMSNTLMSTVSFDWPKLLTQIRTESDVITPFDGIPQIMSGEDFRRSYGDVESPEYQAMLDKIEARIDALALHQN